MNVSMLFFVYLVGLFSSVAAGADMLSGVGGNLGVGMGAAGLKKKPVGGWKEISDLSAAEVQAAATQAAWAYAARGSKSDGSATLSKLATVRNARSQLVAGVHYKMRLAVIATECGVASAAAASADALSSCAPQLGATAKDLAVEFTVWAQPWKPEGERWPSICWISDDKSDEMCVKSGA